MTTGTIVVGIFRFLTDPTWLVAGVRRILLLTFLTLPALAQTDRAEAVLAWQQDANTRCRGGSGDNQATWQACGERDAYGRVLNAMGWCYGRRGEIGAAMSWHRCEANSNRP